jgi:hypothetical protein
MIESQLSVEHPVFKNKFTYCMRLEYAEKSEQDKRKQVFKKQKGGEWGEICQPR